MMVDFLARKYILVKVHTLVFFKAQCYYTLNCTVVNFYMHWESKNCVTHFIIVFALLWWSGFELTVSLGHASVIQKLFFTQFCFTR